MDAESDARWRSSATCARIEARPFAAATTKKLDRELIADYDGRRDRRQPRPRQPRGRDRAGGPPPSRSERYSAGHARKRYRRRRTPLARPRWAGGRSASARGTRSRSTERRAKTMATIRARHAAGNRDRHPNASPGRAETGVAQAAGGRQSRSTIESSAVQTGSAVIYGVATGKLAAGAGAVGATPVGRESEPPSPPPALSRHSGDCGHPFPQGKETLHG